MEHEFGDIEIPESNVGKRLPTAVKNLFKAVRKKHKISNPFTEEDRIREISECLRDGANINAVDERDKKKTILHIAVQRGYKKTVQFLVEKGADKNIKSTDMETPLDIANELNNSGIITLLEEQVESGNDVPGNSADVKDKNQKGTEGGHRYEKLLITLLSAKGFERFKVGKAECNPFGVGREVKVGEQFKFDDVVFMYSDQNNPKNIIFVQSKHKVSANRKITSKILSSSAYSKAGMKKAFNLEKYFISYLEARESLKNTKSGMLKNGKIKYLVLFTNAGLNIKDLKKNGFRLKKAPDDVIGLLNALKSENHCYQLEKLSDKLQKKLEKHSDLYKLAKGSKRSITDYIWYILSRMYYVMLVLYHIWFIFINFPKFVIDLCINRYHFQTIKSPQKLDEEEEEYFKGHFKDDFIDNEDEGTKRNLGNATFEAIRELDKSKKYASPEELKTLLRDTKLKLPHSFGKKNQEDEVALPKAANDVTDFLKYLVLIVNQPCAEDFEKYVNNVTQDIVLKKTLLSHLFEKLKSVGPGILKRIEKLIKIDEKAHHKEWWLLDEEIAEIIQEIVQQVDVLSMITMITIIYENDIMKWGKFKLGQIKETLDDFLQNKEKKVLGINTPETALSSIKILKYFSNEEGYRAENGRISVNLNDLITNGYQNIVVEAFKLQDSKLLTIQCTETNRDQVLEEFYKQLSNIVKDKPEKQIILVMQPGKHNILRENFMADFQNTGEYVSESDEINIKDFEPKRDFDPLKQEVILFPGQRKKISLSKLIDITNWKSYLDELSKYEDGECIIDASSLVQLLNGEEIIIGSEPPRISSLEGAYAKLFEEINKETFRDKLFDDMSGDLFIISGINGSDKEKINELIHYLGIEDRRVEIENKVGNIQSGYKIQIEDDQFKDEQFVRLCKKYPNRNFFWIIMKNENFIKNENIGKGENHSENKNKVKFILYQFYNPDFYINRKFIDKVFITKEVKHQLINLDHSEIFIISGATNQDKFTKSFEFCDKNEEQQFRNNCRNGKIRLANNELKAESHYEILSKQQGVKTVHWLTFEESRLVWRNSHGSFQNLRKYIDKEPGKEFINKVFITKEVKHQLLNPDLSEVFIFSGVIDIDEFTKSFKFSDTDKVKLRKNYNNLKIRLLNSEQEGENHFETLSKQQGIKMLHWLTFEESRLVWRNSCGSLENLSNYTDKKQRKKSLTKEDILIKEIKHKKVVIIADDPGMGKSTTLTILYESRNESGSILESHWVIKINLRDHLQAIKDIDSENIDGNIVKKFLSKLDLNLDHSLARNLLRIALNKNENSTMMLLKPLLIAFDGFDELLDEEDRNKIISLLKFLKNESGVKFWITTRLHFKPDLENALSTFAIEFHPIEEGKKKFIIKYLKDRMSLILSKGSFEDVFGNNNNTGETTKITKYTNAFSIKMESVFEDSTSNFLGTPLQLYLMLEGSVTYFKNWIQNYDSQPLSFDYLGKDIWEVYEKFIERKYEIYFKKTDVKEQVRQKQDKKNFNQYHKDLAESLILKSEHKESFIEFKDILLSVGIVKSQGSIFEFIHPTFGEYFAAKLFIHWIEKSPHVLQNPKKQEYLIKTILMGPSSYELIRKFMNTKLKEEMVAGKIPEENLRQYGEIIGKIFRFICSSKRIVQKRLLRTALFEENEQIVKFLFNCLEKTINPQGKIAEFLSVELISRQGEFRQYTMLVSDKIFELIIHIIEEYLHKNQLCKLLRNNEEGTFIKTFDAPRSQKRSQMFLALTYSKLSQEELWTSFKQTDLHRAVITNNEDEINSIQKRNLERNDLFHMDKFGKTVLHYSVAGKKLNFTNEILIKAKEISSEEEFKSFLCKKDVEDNTVFEIAARNYDFEIIKLILGSTECLHNTTGICEWLRDLNDNSKDQNDKIQLLVCLTHDTACFDDICEHGDNIHTYFSHLYGQKDLNNYGTATKHH